MLLANKAFRKFACAIDLLNYGMCLSRKYCIVSKILLRQSMHINLKNNLATFHPNPV